MIKTITLSGKYGADCVVDADTYEKFSCYRWRVSRSGYVVVGGTGMGSEYPLHRLIMNPPPGFVVDHINRDKLDNRKENLRICTNAENIRNSTRREGNKTGYKGVHFREEKYEAKIVYQFKQYYLGRYDNARDAAIAYNTAARIFFGDFGYINKIDK